MFKNYCKTAFKNFWRYKVVSFINVMGLSVGMTACFMIFLYVSFETGYDKFHSKAGRIYRLVCDTKTPGVVSRGFYTSAAMAANLKAEFPEVEKVTSFSRGNLLVRKDNVKFQEENTLNVDPDFFSLFDFSLKQGNPNLALTRPVSIVLSETAAKKYFGTADPMGQSVLLSQNNWIGTVTGIMKDIPENSQIKADILFFSGRVPNTKSDTDWNNLNYITYILLKNGADPKALETKLPPKAPPIYREKYRPAAQSRQTVL
jgi:putative ABC transport system permease protein